MSTKKNNEIDTKERKYRQFSDGFDMGVGDALVNKHRQPKNQAANRTPKFQGYIAGQYFVQKSRENKLNDVYKMAHRYLRENGLEDVRGLYGESYIASKQR